MYLKNTLTTTFLLFLWVLPTFARHNFPEGYKNTPLGKPDATASLRNDCSQGSSRFDMDINNVRATLLSSGDVWWDLSNGNYIVPKVQAGSGAKAVSSLYAGAVWLGGRDPGGNLKVAVQTYRNADRTDFWPGPLNAVSGATNATTCEQWDKHFVVSGKNIDSLIRLFRAAKASGRDKIADKSRIPTDVLGWPAQGNEDFFRVHGFELPNTTQGLAKFKDENGNGIYEPEAGDYPTIDVKGCDIDVFPDQMVFWIYNDNGNVHTQSTQSTPIQMEIQVQAFAYATNDELNDMTFQRYKLINRAVQDIDSTYFAMWVDPDLGCPTDDYVGCDTTRDLMYVYNQDAIDGTATGSSVCDFGINTYGDKIPVLGVDYFRGPNDEFGRELGMSSFTYYLSSQTCNPLPGTTDPSSAREYYNYLTGKWRDGTPFSFGGSGYAPSNPRTVKYAFPSEPTDANGWSACSANVPCGDRRTIQASGPFKLKPGAKNELIIGVPWVADQKYPCPDIKKLQEADDIAQALFDNCFKIQDGPDAPDLTAVELDKELILVLSNDNTISNNAFENYKEKGLRIPNSQPDTLYRFQGYKIFQLLDANVGVADLENTTKARLVGQVDVQDSVSKIFNWTSLDDPNFEGREIFNPVLKVDGENKGVRHTFRVTKDLFATGDNKLINHKKYYFLAVAYAYNNYAKFDEKRSAGQREAYIVGRRNIGDGGGGKPYAYMPRPLVQSTANAAFGEGVPITRLDGTGNGGNFLDLTDESLQQIINGTLGNEIAYKEGLGPINIRIYNPLEVKDGNYELSLIDATPNDNTLDSTSARWVLKNLTLNESVTSEKTIEQLNEQTVALFGFSVSIAQVQRAGVSPFLTKANGAIGGQKVYANPNAVDWLQGMSDGATIIPNFADLTNFIKTNLGEIDYSLDPNQSLSNGILGGSWQPYYLADYRFRSRDSIMLSPAWISPNGSAIRNSNSLGNLNNIDIVFTKDKSKWSRCVVIETASIYATNNGYETEGFVKQFDLRQHTSVGKDDTNNDGFPDPDGLNQTGMGWFPGYAIDVETGKRLNIFFGESTVYDKALGNKYLTGTENIGRDMAFNPSSQVLLDDSFDPNFAAFLGGQHYIYATNQPYDSCKLLRDRLTGAALRKVTALRNITWTSLPVLTQGQKMLSYRDGLIPNDVTIKLRVNSNYQPLVAANKNKGYPTYRFEVKGKQATLRADTAAQTQLDFINVVPNPYYGFSNYELSEFTTTIKITNLPPKSTITIYTLDGKFIRRFERDEKDAPININNAGVRTMQFAPDVEWDLKNEKGIPVASGVYLMHVQAPNIGERTLKWFGINREFDPSRL